jgi:hypothetical protein
MFSKKTKTKKRQETRGRTLLERGECEGPDVFHQFRVRSWFSVLTIRLRLVVLSPRREFECTIKKKKKRYFDLALEVEGFDDSISHLFDAHLFFIRDLPKTSQNG